MRFERNGLGAINTGGDTTHNTEREDQLSWILPRREELLHKVTGLKAYRYGRCCKPVLNDHQPIGKVINCKDSKVRLWVS